VPARNKGDGIASLLHVLFVVVFVLGSLPRFQALEQLECARIMRKKITSLIPAVIV
jgi:hypothetical protein